MQKIITTIILLLCLNTLSAQWQWVSPQMQDFDLRDVCAVDGVVYAVGGFGTIIKSIDSGNSWQKLNSGTGNSLTKVVFTDANTGYIAGVNTFLLKTIDGGQSWSELNQCPTFVNTFSCISADTVVVGGISGKMAKTTDGGQSWTSYDLASNKDIEAIDFVNADIGWAVVTNHIGYLNQSLLKTVDGGQTWVRQVLSFQNMYSISFTDSLNGWVSGYKYNENIGSAKTSDGGKTWSHLPLGRDNVYFISKNLGFFNFSRKTNDGGMTSYPMNFDCDLSSFDSKIYGISFDNTQLGYMIGNNGLIFKSTDGGDNWVSLSSHSTSNLYALAFTNNQTGYAAGDNSNNQCKGIILKTNNAGESWSNPLDIGAVNPLRVIQFVNEQTGYAAGENGTIIKTVNSGDSWTTLNTGIVKHINAISFYDLQTGYAAGLDGVIIKTVNGGQSWSIVNSGTSHEILTLCFTDLQTGYFGNDKGQIYKTTDGGINWNLNFSYADYCISKIFFKDALNGFAGNSNGVIFRTIDGGQNWSSFVLQSPYSGYGIKSFCFPLPNTGYASCEAGLMLKTTNGGESWFCQPPITYKTLNSVCFTTDNIGVAVGLGGLIIHTTNGGETAIKSKDYNLPDTALLLQNYPNPFNNQTVINYELQATTSVKLTVYNAKGEIVKILVNGLQNRGNHSVTLDAVFLNSGVYFYKLDVGDRSFVHKMILLK